MIEQLRIIERESRRCGDIIKNLLTYARQAPQPPRGAELNDRRRTRARAGAAQARIAERRTGGALRRGLCRRCGAIRADPAGAVVLLVNAAEAMPHGRAVGGGDRNRSRRRAAARLVRDNGGGIPQEVLPRIFEPFFTTKEEQQRTGLGLAVAQSIVEQHCGDITVRSTPGQGTEFTMTLPVTPRRRGPIRSCRAARRN